MRPALSLVSAAPRRLLTAAASAAPASRTTSAFSFSATAPSQSPLPFRSFSVTAMSSAQTGDTTKPGEKELPAIKFDKTPIGNNPLGEGNYVKTAGCLIIGDEVLNGKTKDSNSNFFAKMCFNLGIELKRIEVIADDEAEIVEAARRMTKEYDFVISSGGIGPTP